MTSATGTPRSDAVREPSPAPVVRDPGSYRDPSGFVYRRDGRILRQCNRRYARHWDAATSSGFLDGLIAEGLLVPHETVGLDLAASDDAHAVIAPKPLEFVSYPYEWTFGQLRDAALLTLELERRAIEAGFTLKDASAYNICFDAGRPVLIDTLSFEVAEQGAAWIAYRQFCQQFLAPLAVMAYRDVRLGLLLRDYIDGLPLDLASRLLPARTRLRFGLLTNVHLHARVDRRAKGRADSAAAVTAPKVGAIRLSALVDGLRRSVEKLTWTPAGTEWADYAGNTSYGAAATEAKDRLVAELLGPIAPRVVWDLGANTGRFSRIAADGGARVVAWDIDPGAAERHYRVLRAAGEARILPLVMDLANPSPGIGWAGAERRSLFERADADAILALALIHHLAITRNVPLPDVAALFARLAPHAVVEWVPKEDPMVQFLLSGREDVFDDYSLDGFRRAFGPLWETVAERPIEGSGRVLFALRRR
jgi:hypothetical protein